MKPKSLRDYEWHQSLEYMAGEAEVDDELARETKEKQSMITYKPNKKNNLDNDVFLDGKLVGTIRALGFMRYQYFPKGKRTGGDVFPSLYKCQQSLEAE